MYSLTKRARLVLLMTPATVLLGLAAALVPIAVADDADNDEISIVSQQVQGNFPDNITFRLSASSPDPIEEVRVFFKPLGGDQSSYAYIEIEPGVLVEGEYSMPTGAGPNHKPPGTVVRYSFEIRDVAGRVLRTDDQEFLYLDSRLEWQKIEKGLLTVYYYGDFVANRAQTVMETAEITMEGMGRLLGIAPQEPINIVAYSNYVDMSRALPFRSQAVREDLQTEGMAFVNQRVFVVLISEENFTGVVSHEFSHILIGEAAGQGYGAVPAWLNEGLAEFGNIDKTPQYDWALNYAVFTRRLKPLWHLDTFGGGPDDIVMAYGQGKSVVEFMIAAFGEEKMAELMLAFHSSLSADEALVRVYGLDQYALDGAWRQAIGLVPLPPPGEVVGPNASGGAESLPPEDGALPSSEDTTAAEDTAAPEVESVPEPDLPEVEATPGQGDDSPAPSAADEGRGGSGSCSAPSAHGSASLDVAALALVGIPFFAWNLRWGLGKVPFSRRLRRSQKATTGQ